MTGGGAAPERAMSTEAPNLYAYTAPAAVQPEIPAAPPTEQPKGKIAVWPVFAVYVATLAACVVAQIPVVILWVAVHVARGGKVGDASELLSSPSGFISLLLPGQCCILAAWWLATRFADPRLAGLRAIGSTTLRPGVMPAWRSPRWARCNWAITWPGA